MTIPFYSHCLLKRIKDLSENKLDDSFNELTVCMMLVYMLPRKQEELYNEIDDTNITDVAQHLINFIPKGSFTEIKSKADRNDPVKI